jgi:hypothetical protein
MLNPPAGSSLATEVLSSTRRVRWCANTGVTCGSHVSLNSAIGEILWRALVGGRPSSFLTKLWLSQRVIGPVATVGSTPITPTARRLAERRGTPGCLRLPRSTGFSNPSAIARDAVLCERMIESCGMRPLRPCRREASSLAAVANQGWCSLTAQWRSALPAGLTRLTGLGAGPRKY